MEKASGGRKGSISVENVWVRTSARKADIGFAILYTLMGVFVTARLWRAIDDRRVEINSDHSQFIWFLRHAVRVITEGVDPFFTNMLNAPDGVNLMANTSALGLTLPMVPVTILFGPEVSFAVLLALGLAATAFGWYLLFSRLLVKSKLAAAVGGAFCGFAPGIISHANGHINWTSQFLVPFLVLAAFRLKTARDGVPLGLLAAYQAFINEEVLLYTVLATGVFMGTYAFVTKTRQRILPGLGVAVAIAGAILAYPLYRQFFGNQTYHGMPVGVAHYRADLASYPAFSRVSFGGSPASDRLSWNISEQNTFFGWPLLLLAAVMTIWLWDRALVRVMAITAGVFFVFSLGENLLVGRRGTGIPLPWALLGRLPLLDHVITVRFGLVLVPLFGALLAITVEFIRSMDNVKFRRLATLGLIAALLPILPVPVPAKARPGVPGFISSGAWREFVQPGQSIVAVPLTSEEFPSAMEWQRSSDDFKLAGGYFLGPDATGRARFGAMPRPTAELMRDVHKTGKVPIVTAEMRQQFRDDVAYWRAAVFVLPDNTQSKHAPQLRSLLNGLAGEGRHVRDVTIWVTG